MWNMENGRIVLLAFVLFTYMIVGALVITRLELPYEQHSVIQFWSRYHTFVKVLMAAVNNTVSEDMIIEQLNQHLFAYGNFTSTFGTAPLQSFQRWDFAGSLHFVATIVTTIGYGSYTPNTTAGRIFVIVYGFFGCAGGILFFNLCLERIVTCLASCLKEIYIRIDKDNADPEEEWKPSVYSVLACLAFASALVVFISVLVYSSVEGWSYLESAYFCFVSFATIGFGDFVAAQGHHYSYPKVYVVLNIFVLATGCCFLYSLFNVLSIVLKQLLNWIIERLFDKDNINKFKRYIGCDRQSDNMLRKYSMKLQKDRRQRRSSIPALRHQRRTLVAANGIQSISVTVEPDNSSACDDTARKMSDDDGLISLKDFLTSNQVSLAVMQKQLYDSAHRRSFTIPDTDHPGPSVAPAVTFPAGRFVPGTIGPLAILCNKLGGNK